MYEFDRSLRLLIFSVIDQIEIALRAQIISQYVFIYGSSWHLNQNLFKDKNYNAFKQSWDDDILRSKERFILKYKSHKDFPAILSCWMCVEVLSFGSLSKLYSNLEDDKFECKINIAKFFGLSPTIFESWLNHISVVRNICAHHGKLWDHQNLPRIKDDSKYYINFRGSKNICISI